jgi:branched-chain amino acid transport system permease protein
MKLERNLIFAFLLVAAALPLVVGDQYLLHIGIMVMFYAVLATSLNLVVGYVGEFSLGHTAFLGIGAYTAAICSLKLGLPMWATLPIAALVSGVFGIAIGAITLRLQGPYFVIVTLAFAEVLRLIANNWIDLTNGPMGLAGVLQPRLLADASNLFGKQF